MRRSPHGQTVDVFDEHGLSGDVVLRYPPHLSLANHVHRFDPLKAFAMPSGRTESPDTLEGAALRLCDLAQRCCSSIVLVDNDSLDRGRRSVSVPL